MRTSVAVPILLAFSGALWLVSKNSPKSDLSNLIAKSKDRKGTENLLNELGRNGPKEFETYRAKQFALSISIGTTTFIAILSARKSPIIGLMLACLIVGITYLAIDRDLAKKVKMQRRMIDSEFPAVIEMYSLALSAGETPLVAMERIANSANGALAKEFSIVVSAVKSGTPFHVALDEMGRGVESVLIRRFVDSLIIATLRGAPLTEVLQRHAEEARQAQRNHVMGAAAKAEISMMVPVVFLILPISILFALWPSLANLNIFLGS